MVCGPENPDGWGLTTTVFPDDGRVRGTITFGAPHEGAPGVAHGGALAAALDDTFGSVLLALRTPGVTANLNVDYRAPVPLHREVVFEAWCDRVAGRKLFMSARALLGDTVLAEATALFIQVPIERFHPEGAATWWKPMPDPASDA